MRFFGNGMLQTCRASLNGLLLDRGRIEYDALASFEESPAHGAPSTSEASPSSSVEISRGLLPTSSENSSKRLCLGAEGAVQALPVPISLSSKLGQLKDSLDLGFITEAEHKEIRAKMLLDWCC